MSAPRGVYAAILTPLTAALEPDLDAFVAHGKWLLAHGCDGLAPLGTTGEANSMSLKQRMRVLEAAGRHLPPARLIIGAGSSAIADAVHLARASLDIGAAGVLLLPPFYYKNPGEDGLFAFFAQVIERTADQRLRAYLYHFPQQSAVPITASLIRRLKDSYGDIIAGLKDSGGEWNYSAGLLKDFPGFGIFTGSEQYLLANLRAGGVGTISASVNVTALLAQPVYAKWREAEADAAQEVLTAARALFKDLPLVGAIKEMMTLISGNPAWRHILPPNTPLAPAQRAELEARLAQLPAMRPVMAASRAA